MKCPACKNEMRERTVDGITVDVCEGHCAGIWFDRYELQKLDEKHELTGGQLLDIQCDPGIYVDRDQQYHCPRCQDVVMMRHYYSVKHQVQVDECGGCGGFWLDQGELEKIRHLYNSPEQQEQDTQRVLAQQFAENLAELKAESEADLQRSQKFVNLFRFLCPSYWIPGKQKGAAF
jgi:uncharacterized protein